VTGSHVNRKALDSNISTGPKLLGLVRVRCDMTRHPYQHILYADGE
jgi:hypothetical protein